MTIAAGANAGLSEAAIAARIERLPPSAWHLRMRFVFGAATFFDAFDLITIATILPTLVALWKLDPAQTGWLIAAGFIGQALGAVGFGYLAERAGRMRAATISILIFATMSLLGALAGSYGALVVIRFAQGIGLGGEVPIAATYINEIARSHNRGRFFLLYECVFLLGVAVCSMVGAFVVPRFGYFWMFILGGVPALLVVPLRRYCPESPRWLASRGRLAEADTSLSRIEAMIARTQALPPPDPASVPVAERKGTSFGELFGARYRRRTLVLWTLWFCSYLLIYGEQTWLPTIYSTVYHLGVETALWLGTIATAAALVSGVCCAVLIDRTGRRRWITAAFFIAAVPMVVLACQAAPAVAETATLATLGGCAIVTVTIILYLYTPELYPTRLRAFGTACATFWPRFASTVGSALIGYILPVYGVRGVFVLFGLVAVSGWVAGLVGGAPETSERLLEDISP